MSNGCFGQKQSNGNRLRHFVSWVPSVRFQPLEAGPSLRKAQAAISQRSSRCCGSHRNRRKYIVRMALNGGQAMREVQQQILRRIVSLLDCYI